MSGDSRFLIAVDGPDPDNLVLVRMASELFGHENVFGVILTGRPVNDDANKGTSLDDWSYAQSKDLQKITAARFVNFMEAYGLKTKIYDGGIAPRTLVPHHVHFNDRLGFDDVDTKTAISHAQLRELSDLRSDIGKMNLEVLVGGPMTGIRDLLVRFPELAQQITVLHAMYGTLGKVQLMDLGGEKRGAKQFNVACDPQAGKYVLDALACPIYLVPTECTRDQRISFATPEDLRAFLPNTKGNQYLLKLYEKWFAGALAPRKEPIYIHDASAAISATNNGTYKFKPMRITNFSYLPSDAKQWGTMEFEPNEKSNIRVAIEISDPERYRTALKSALEDKA